MTDGVSYARLEDNVAGMDCTTCGEKMDVKRKVNGPTGFAEAMAQKFHLHDRFSCPFREEMWHRQICKLTEAACKSPSKQIAGIMIAEALEIVESRQATKEVSKY